MSWYRVDDQSAFHSTVLRLGNSAWGAATRLGAHARWTRSDGYVTREAVFVICSRRDLAKLLAPGPRGEPAFLVQVEGGYQIRDFLQHNPSEEELAEDREKRAAGGRQRQAAVRAARDAATAQDVASGEANSGPASEPVPASALLVQELQRRSSSSSSDAEAPAPAPAQVNTKIQEEIKSPPTGRDAGERACVATAVPESLPDQTISDLRAEAPMAGWPDPDAEWEKFRLDRQAKGLTRVDWVADFRAWLNRARGFAARDRERARAPASGAGRRGRAVQPTPEGVPWARSLDEIAAEQMAAFEAEQAGKGGGS